MGGTPQAGNPVIVSAFRGALVHQFLVLALIGALLVVAWNAARALDYRRSTAAGRPWNPAAGRPVTVEPAARRFFRIVFGLLWVVDGLLQTQASMPLGLPGSVLTPAAASSPGWVRHLVAAGAGVWSDHPVSAAASTVWIEIGVGILLVAAPRGRWSRTAGMVAAGWGAIVWVTGEAFGGLLGPGVSWLTGAPGAALCYVAAGILVALPERSWRTPRPGRVLLRSLGALFVVLGVLQAWPGRGSWSGRAHGNVAAGPVTGFVEQMAHMSQPSVSAAWMRWFASFQGGHAAVVNLIVVVGLLGVGGAFLTADVRAVRLGVAVGWVLCLVVWVLVQDLGILGGVGTDPNSMIPLALLFTGGYLAISRLPAPAAATPRESMAPDTVAPVPEPVPVPVPEPVGGRWARLSLNVPLRTVLAVGAVAVVLVGAAPMVAAAADHGADPLLIEAVDGRPTLVDSPAPLFTLTDTQGRRVSLASLRGRTVVLTFLDPVCTSDCPLIAQDLRVADQQVGAGVGPVELVAVDVNPLYLSTASTAAFDRQEGLERVRNWTYLTGSRTELQQVWNRYGVQAVVEPAGGMVDHADIVYVIDRHGRTRVILNADPGDGGADSASFVTQLTNQIGAVARS